MYHPYGMPSATEFRVRLRIISNAPYKGWAINLRLQERWQPMLFSHKRLLVLSWKRVRIRRYELTWTPLLRTGKAEHEDLRPRPQRNFIQGRAELHSSWMWGFKGCSVVVWVRMDNDRGIHAEVTVSIKSLNYKHPSSHLTVTDVDSIYSSETYDHLNTEATSNEKYLSRWAE